jgi:hypothetical protein
MHPNHNGRSAPDEKPVLSLILALALAAVTLATPLTAHADGPAGNLINNWGLESYQSPYDDYNGYDLRVASGWQKFAQSSRSDWNVRFMTDADYAECFSTQGGVTRHTEGNYSQNLWLGHWFNAGIYQKDITVTSGKPYGIKAMIFSAVGSNSPSGAKMVKRVGIDPAGGTDPYSSMVIWGDPDDANKNFNDIRGAARATASKITVFISVTNVIDVYPDWNAAWIDAVLVEEAPQCAASSPSTSPSGSFTVSWGASNPPNGAILYYDVQYKDGFNGAWTAWYTKATARQDTFSNGQIGHTYYFRARAWASYSGIKLYGPFTSSPDGDCSTSVGNAIAGKVDRYDGQPASGASVSIQGTAMSTTTDGNGSYVLTLPNPGTYRLAVSAPNLTSPAPITINVASGTGVLNVPLTLRALDEPVANGDFEAALSNGWNSSSTDANSPVIETDFVRSGAQTLALRRGAIAAGYSEIWQTLSLSAMWDPILSFYAAMPVTHAGDTLEVGTFDGSTCTPRLTTIGTSGWAHYWLRLMSGNRDFFSGSLGICFRASQASADMQAYLDEISVGRGTGGPIDTFLPLLTQHN